MRWVLSTFEFTLKNAGQESNLRDPKALADGARIEIMAGRRLAQQEPQESYQSCVLGALLWYVTRMRIPLFVRSPFRFSLFKHKEHPNGWAPHGKEDSLA